MLNNDRINRILADEINVLEKDIDRAEALASAWKAVTFPTKKDGSEFAVFSKNFDGCKVNTKSYALVDCEKEMTVYTYSVMNGYINDSIDCYETINKYRDCNRADDHPDRVVKPSTYLVPFYIKSVDDMKEDIQKRIDYYASVVEDRKNSIALMANLPSLLNSISDLMVGFKEDNGQSMARIAEKVIQGNWYSVVTGDIK